jgi:hypothetical protein
MCSLTPTEEKEELSNESKQLVIVVLQVILILFTK